MALNVGNLVATMRLDVSQYEAGLSGARQSLGTLDSALAAAKASAANLPFDPSMATSAARAAAAVEGVREAAIQAAAAAQGVRLDDGVVQQAARSAAGVDDLTRAITEAGTRATGTASNVGQVGAQATGAAGDVAKIEAALTQAAAAAGQVGQQVGNIGPAGQQAGAEAGEGIVDGVASKVGDLGSKTGPIGAALLGVVALGLSAGALLIGALRDGMQTELTQDLFRAQTGLDEATVRRFGLVAGEAYGNAFGESVEANLATVKTLFDNGLVDASSTNSEVQSMIEQFTGLADIVEGDVGGAIRAVDQLVGTGLAGSVTDAMDLIVAATQQGGNAAGDLLDTVTEYASGWETAGFSGKFALGLVTQALDNNILSADYAGDAIREFGRRLTEEPEKVAAAIDAVGLSSAELVPILQAGGAAGEVAFDQVFDAIRAIEDPAAQAAAIIGVLGDASGDFTSVFAEWDPSAAAAGFTEIAGAAADAVSVMEDNSSSSVTGALNSASAAADGLKASLAVAVGPWISDLANQISNNREGVIGFFVDLGDGAFGVLEALVGMVAGASESAAGLVDSLGGMTASALSILGELTAGIGAILVHVPGMGDMGRDLVTAGADMTLASGQVRAAAETSSSALRTMGSTLREDVLPAVQVARTEFARLGGDQVALAAFNDQLTQVNNTVAAFAESAIGAIGTLQGWTGTLDTTVPAQAAMDGQLRALSAGFLEQTRTGLEAGATVSELTAQYGANREALLASAVQMGLTEQEAAALVDQYGLVPDLVATQIAQPGMPQAKSELDELGLRVRNVPNSKTIDVDAPTGEAQQRLRDLGYTVQTLPGGQVRVTANTGPAEDALRYLTRPRSVTVRVNQEGGLRGIGNTVAGARAEGGPVAANRPYWVGEEGPELVFPSRAGFVATAQQSANVVNGSAAGSTIDYQRLAAVLGPVVAAAVSEVQLVAQVDLRDMARGVSRHNRDRARVS